MPMLVPIFYTHLFLNNNNNNTIRNGIKNIKSNPKNKVFRKNDIIKNNNDKNTMKYHQNKMGEFNCNH